MKIPISIEVEMESAAIKYPTWPIDPIHALAILNEEVGELEQAILQATYGGGNSQRVRAEAKQVAAMALQFYLNLPTYHYLPSKQEPKMKIFDLEEGPAL